MHSVSWEQYTYCAHPFCSPVFSQVTDAMRRMHERQNIGKVILLPEPKKVEEEKPKSDPEPVENVEKSEAAVSEKKEEATEEVKAEKD